MSNEDTNPWVGQEIEMFKQGLLSFIMEWIQADLRSVGGDTSQNTHLHALTWVRTLCDDIEKAIDEGHMDMAKGNN